MFVGSTYINDSHIKTIRTVLSNQQKFSYSYIIQGDQIFIKKPKGKKVYVYPLEGFNIHNVYESIKNEAIIDFDSSVTITFIKFDYKFVINLDDGSKIETDAKSNYSANWVVRDGFLKEEIININEFIKDYVDENLNNKRILR